MCAKLDVMRALVSERLTAAAEEIFALVQRTIAEYEKELCRSKEENLRKQQLLDSLLTRTSHRSHTEGVQTEPISLEPSVKQEIPKIPQIKEEPEDPELLRLSQEDEQLPEFTEVCVKTEEQELSDSSSDTDDDEDWDTAAGSSAAQTETDGDHSHQVLLTDLGPERKFECPLCSKIVTTKQSLEGHFRTHTGEKPYICSVCGKAFSIKGNLNKHMKVHTGDRPYSCSVCEKTFALKDTLKKHMRTHTGEKPYSCPICNKAFVQNCNLKMHMRSHINL